MKDTLIGFQLHDPIPVKIFHGFETQRAIGIHLLMKSRQLTHPDAKKSIPVQHQHRSGLGLLTGQPDGAAGTQWLGFYRQLTDRDARPLVRPNLSLTRPPG